VDIEHFANPTIKHKKKKKHDKKKIKLIGKNSCKEYGNSIIRSPKYIISIS
jgi:hypothetical protein